MSDWHRIWRIATQGPGWRADDLSGAGAAQDPGRWNSLGVPVVYASTSISLACLETLVHISGDQGLPLVRWLVSIDCPSQHWQQRSLFNPDDLVGWNATPPVNGSMNWGDQWIASQQSLLAQVPSVIVPEECNVLINPAHPSRFDLRVTIRRRWSYDHRLR